MKKTVSYFWKIILQIQDCSMSAIKLPNLWNQKKIGPEGDSLSFLLKKGFTIKNKQTLCIH